MVVALMTLLERWSAGPERFCRYLPAGRGFDEAEIFQAVITSPDALTFAQLAQLVDNT